MRLGRRLRIGRRSSRNELKFKSESKSEMVSCIEMIISRNSFPKRKHHIIASDSDSDLNLN
jgi:hypothetical protein